MPKHRKNKPNQKPDKNKANKPQSPRPPREEAEDQGAPEEFDDAVSAAVAAYLSGLDDSEQATVAAEVRRLLDALGDNFEIIAGDEEDEDLDEVSPGLRPKVPVDQLLQRLIQDRELPPILDLFAFSDLAAQDVEVVRQQWELVDVARRRHAVAELVAMVEEDIDLELGRFLRVAMGDSDAQVRQTAISGLWGTTEADLLGPFVQLLSNDSDVGVRAAAATALGPYILAGELDELDSALAMRAEEGLLAVLNNEMEPLEVRRRALESIAYSGEAGVRQLIEDGYYASNEAMRVSAVFAMGRSADVRWRGLVRAELRSPSADMRAEAATASGELGAMSAAEDLIELLQDREERVRLAAISALGQLGGPVAQDALETVLLSDDPVEVEAAEAALEELQFFGQMDALSLFDETDEEEDEWESDAKDEEWYDDLEDEFDEDDLGEYEDDPDDSEDGASR